MFDLVARAQDALAAIGTLSEPEIAMLEAAQSGLERDCSPATDKSLKIRAVLVRWLLGYGYRPHLALAWAAAFVCLGAALVYVGDTANLLDATRAESTTYRPLNSFMYSLDVLLPVGNLRQEDYWWPNAGKHCAVPFDASRAWACGSALRAYLWFHNLAGWILTTLLRRAFQGLCAKIDRGFGAKQ